jgi:Transposase IS66 family
VLWPDSVNHGHAGNKALYKKISVSEQGLTLFLREPGCPLDNKIAERALKKAILNRKNCLFYKTLKGAEVGDLYMSLIHTCELDGANPPSYLTELLRHADELVQTHGLDALELPGDLGTTAVKACLIVAALCSPAESSRLALDLSRIRQEGLRWAGP